MNGNHVCAVVLGVLVSGSGFAAATSNDFSNPNQVQPYIESLRKKYDLPPASSEPSEPLPAEEPTPAQKGKLSGGSDNPREVQPYIESLRRKEGLPSSDQPAPPVSGTAKPEEVQPYIESVKKDGELQPKTRGTVSQAAGFSIVAANTFNVTSGKVQANSFQSVYSPDTKYSPSAEVFYEYQVFRNPYLGAFGLAAHLNMITIKGKGVFTKTGVTSTDTSFRFYAMPVSIGGTYRFLQLRFVDPYVHVSAVGIPFFETRDDQHPSRRGISRGFNLTPGVAINLDWVSRKDAWNQYDSAGILHTYLIAQYELIRTLAGSVTFNYNGLYAGLMFEF